jgi:hypothetical protein
MEDVLKQARNHLLQARERGVALQRLGKRPRSLGAHAIPTQAV